MQPDPKRIGWKFGALWTLASAFGYCAGGAVMGLVENMGLPGMERDYWTVAGGAMLGCLGGFGQWLVLRTQISRAAWWILANAAGWSYGYLAGDLCSKLVPGSGILYVIAVYLPIAVLQWLVLRRTARRAFWWIIVSATATPLGYVAGFLAGFDVYCICLHLVDNIWLSYVGGYAGGGFVGGLVFGLITAWPLTRLLRNRLALPQAPTMNP